MSVLRRDIDHAKYLINDILSDKFESVFLPSINKDGHVKKESKNLCYRLLYQRKIRVNHIPVVDYALLGKNAIDAHSKLDDMFLINECTLEYTEFLKPDKYGTRRDNPTKISLSEVLNEFKNYLDKVESNIIKNEEINRIRLEIDELIKIETKIENSLYNYIEKYYPVELIGKRS